MRIAPKIVLTEEERTALNVWLHIRVSASSVLRAKIILLAADGRTNKEIARQLGVTRKTVSLWRRRFVERRLAGIEKEAPRRKLESKTDETVQLILQKMKNGPANVAHWTVRSLAQELGIPRATLHRLLKAAALHTCLRFL